MSNAEDLIALAVELGESVNGRPENVDAALPRLESILAESADDAVIVEAVLALGHAWDPRAARVLLDRVRVDHRDGDVRFALARSLLNGVEPDDACWQDVVTALVRLSADEEADVRDWACFGLGQIEAESPEVCDALAARLTDTDDDARCEAVWALARAGDERAREHLERRLTERSDDSVFMLELKAAAELAHPVFHPLLVSLGDDWQDDDDEFVPALAFAIARCRPEARSEAEQIERALVARFNALVAGEQVSGAVAGHYPRTRLTARDEGGAPVPRFNWSVWSDYEPGTFPLEQEASSYRLTLQRLLR